MKINKIQKNIFKWGSTEFKDPYCVIRDIFHFADIGFFRKFIHEVLWHCSKPKKYKNEHTGNLIFLLDGLSCLLSACNAINKKRKKPLIEVRKADLINPKFYSLKSSDTEIWSDFPRVLNEEEISNPYIALKNIYKHKTGAQWYEIFKDLAEYSCSSYVDGLEENLFEVYIQLVKLFEAAHLIYIREIAFVDNWRDF